MKCISPKAFPLSLFLALAALLATALFTAPPVGKAASRAAQAERVFFGNLRSRTSYSNGSGTTEEAYRYVRDDKDAKLDFMTLTEHSEQVHVLVILWHFKRASPLKS